MAHVPTRIGEFDVVRQIGAGGMGEVYLGRDTRLDRQVAIKVLRGEIRDQEVLDRFFREAKSAAALRHPNIVTIYASGQHIRQPYMVMEFVDGEPLGEIIHQRRNLPLSDKLSYLEQICSALHYAHQAGIVHRDVKPANIMVDRQGVVRILDFGIARIEGSAMTMDGTMVGSLNYMSPEQMLGRQVDHRSDMFSLGSVAYELLCYQQAFKGSVSDGLLQRLPNEDPPPLRSIREDLPDELEVVIGRALQKDPDRRYADLGEMRQAILAVAHELPQDDVRTVLVRPRPRSSSDAAPMTPVPQPTKESDGATAPSGPLTLWGGARAEVPDTIHARPAWAAPPPTRVVRPEGGTTTTAPRQSPSTAGVRPLTTPTGQTAPRLRDLPAARTSARGGIVLGSLLGVCILAVMGWKPWWASRTPTPLEREQPAIEAALERYRAAYRTRDMEAMAVVFPGIPAPTARAMEQTFTRCMVYDVTFDGIRMDVNAQDETMATAEVRNSHTCTPRSGGAQSTIDYRDLISLRKNDDTWVVEKVEGAPVRR